MNKKTILVPKKECLLSPEAYLLDLKLHRDIISDVVFIPPKVGGKDFGMFRVRYDIPILFSV